MCINRQLNHKEKLKILENKQIHGYSIIHTHTQKKVKCEIYLAQNLISLDI